jgi:hypothetical protein
MSLASMYLDTKLLSLYFEQYKNSIMSQEKIWIIYGNSKLEGNSNYVLWRFCINHVLKTEGLCDIIANGKNNTSARNSNIGRLTITST